MGRRNLAILLALLALPSLAGCFSDLERVRFDTSWEAEATLHRGPDAMVGGVPAQLVVEGPISITDGPQVEFTGLSASLAGENRSIGLQPARLQVDGQTLVPSVAVDQAIELSDGDHVRVSFLPSSADGVQLGNATNWTVDAELRYRFRDGPTFDAGRFPYEANLTPERSARLGVGVPVTEGDQIASAVFADVERQAPTGEADVRVFRVTSDEVTRRANRTANLTPGTGVQIATLSSPVGIPTGSGYQLLVLQANGATGVVAKADRPTEEPVPGVGGLTLVAALAATAWGRVRRFT